MTMPLDRILTDEEIEEVADNCFMGQLDTTTDEISCEYSTFARSIEAKILEKLNASR